MNSLHASYSSAPVHQHFGTGHVLVIDGAAKLAALSDTLVGHGRTSTFTRDPEHALRVLNELQPDQVLLAVDDSDGNNVTYSELVRAAVAQGAHVVVLGPDPESERARNILAQGASTYLRDSADAGDVWAAVQAKSSGEGSSANEVLPTKSVRAV